MATATLININNNITVISTAVGSKSRPVPIRNCEEEPPENPDGNEVCLGGILESSGYEWVFILFVFRVL